MDFKNTLVNVALVGTNKKHLSITDLPVPLQDISKPIFENTQTDKETQFLHIGALCLNTYKAGYASQSLNLQANEAEEETSPYCSKEATMILQETLGNNYTYLTWLWITLCVKRGEIAPPHLLIALFKWGNANKGESLDLFVKVIGNRGKWLSQFDTSWDFVNVREITEIDWETADSKSRIQYLKKLRKQSPSKALELIQKIWTEENAAARQDLLEVLHLGIGEQDEIFLESCLQDKSSKVKEKVYELLKLIPKGKILTAYKQTLASSITLSNNKLLGFISQKNIQIQLTILNEDIFKTGIQKLSSDKKIKDNDYILYQLISNVEPDFWKSHFSLSREEIIQLFDSKEELAYFRNALCESIIKFQNKDWATCALEKFGKDEISLLYLLDIDDLCKYAEPFLKNSHQFDLTVQLLVAKSDIKDWPLSLSKVIIKEFAKNIFWNNKSLCEAMSLYLPFEILGYIQDTQSPDETRKGYWNNIKEEFTRHIHLKENIKKELP